MTFSEYFKLEELETEFLDINLRGDYPFFIDPLLLCGNSKLPNAYENFLEYFENDNSTFIFKEIKQTHLGFGYQSNSGHGIGKKIGNRIRDNHFMKKYGFELDTIDIFIDGVGIDLISDMTTNIILEDLCEYTRNICDKYNIQMENCAIDNGNIKPIYSYLPVYEGEYIILVPKSILRKNNLVLSKKNFIKNMYDVVQTIENESHRYRLNKLLHKKVYVKSKNDTEYKIKPQSERKKIIKECIEIDPNIINNFKEYMIKKDFKTNVTSDDCHIHNQTIQIIDEITLNLINHMNFCVIKESNFVNSIRNIILYYKNEIENTDFVNTFNIDGMKDEKHHQRIFRTVGKNSNIGLNSEVNNGNGPVDFKCINEKESVLIEFKLAKASNAKNIYNQLHEYFKVNLDAKYAFAVIIVYSNEELKKANKIKSTNTNPNIETIIIECISENYKSASIK